MKIIALPRFLEYVCSFLLNKWQLNADQLNMAFFNNLKWMEIINNRH